VESFVVASSPMSKGRPIHYWDSVCGISYLREDAGRFEACSKVIEAAESGDIEIALSTLTIAEVLHLKGEPRLTPEMRDVVRRFFRRSMFMVVSVDRQIAERAQDLFWDHGIKPKDAIHVASALRANASTLDTFDDGLIGKSELIGGEPPLIICRPSFTPEPKKPARKGDENQLEIAPPAE
jgi:predicted nucleic acid-binding protein